MLSLSDNEFAVINYLTRNFSSRDTIRSIAKKLSFSPAGVYNILKKLEKQNIVTGERFGTGLFYKLNLNNKVCQYLALTTLVGFYDYTLDISKFTEQAKIAIYDKKTVLMVVENPEQITESSIGDAKLMAITHEEFTEDLKDVNSEVSKFVKTGTVVSGESELLEIIKRFVDRF